MCSIHNVSKKKQYYLLFFIVAALQRSIVKEITCRRGIVPLAIGAGRQRRTTLRRARR